MEEKSSSTDPALTKPSEQNDSSSSSSSVLNENKKEVEKEKKSVEEVIDLDDSNDEDNKPNTKRPPRKCINAQCTGDDVDLKVAASYCISFFKVKCNRKKKQLVCKDCRKMCLNNMQIMADMLSKGEPIFDHKVPMNVDSVEIIDSDEETIDDESEKSTLEEKDKEELNLEIDELVKRLFDKYNIGYQINWAKDKLERDNKKNEEHFKEIDELLKRLQVKADIVRSSVYSNRPRNTELEPLDIVDDYSVGVAQKSTASHIIGRRSSPRITKPVSYNEDNSPDSPTISPPGHGDQEIIAVDVTKKIVPNLPPVGQIVRPEPKVGNLFYAMKSNTFGSWAICEVLEIMSTGINGKASENVRYRIKFEGIKAKTAHLVKIVSAKKMAYTTKSPVRLHIGNRVIAVFKDSEQTQRRDLFAGIVAEPLSSLNSFRYLIFFDDGYAQYVAHDNVHLFVEESTNVWEDVPLESRDYIKGYLKEYPERPMVKLTRGQIIKTEWNGKWWTARVLQVDGSLVLMYFDADKRSEWIYRGSRRLAPLFNTNQNQKMRQIKGFVTPQRRLPPRKQNAPYVEYTRNTEYVEPTESEQDHPAISTASRAVARKSTSVTAINFGSKSAPQTIVPFLPTTITQPASKVIYYAPRAGTIPALYKSHQCSPNCNKLTKRKLSDLKNYSLLAKPILSGWFRECIRYSKNKREIRYITPCSRILRTIQELHLYLRITQSEMSVDMFDFNFWVHILAEFCIEKTYVNLPDLSNGEENVPIPCVNYIDCTLPDMCRYTSKREPMQGVNLNLDEQFLCGCDCTDDCQDKTKCACWQLTIQGTMYGKNKVPDMNIGYVYKRLLEPVITGIYECNSRCKCASTCLNRVAQHPLQLKLQVFKTANRGWGIRCLNDVPQGSFICIYAGQLLTEQMANEGGKNFGDEYLAELDYIEVVERLKEGYESDVSEEDMDLSYEDKKDSSQDEEDDDEEDEVPDTRYKRISNKYKDDDSEYVVHTYIAKTNTYNTRLRKRYDETDSNSNSNQGSDSERNEKRARKYGEKSKDDHGKNELMVTEYTTEGRRKDGIDNVNDKIKDINLSSSEQKNEKKQGELPEEKSIENSEDAITGSNAIKQEINSETVKDQSKNTMDEDEYVTISDDEMPVTREPSSFIPTVPAEENIENWELKYKSVRTMFGETESCYVMDAKNAGNIGRFLNHSCNPNVFVQNVFVDTHDIRFPWVAFFALTYIRAGTELTWNYNYDVGSVPGKVLYCQCGSSECRGRLL